MTISKQAESAFGTVLISNVELLRAETFAPRWRGLRLVAADASRLRIGLRASHVRRAALADQVLFGLFFPGPDLMLAAALHSVHERGERQFLIEHLDRLSPDDLLLLDRGYPCRWLVSVLNHRMRPQAGVSRYQPITCSSG